MNLYNVKDISLNETSGISFNIYTAGCKGYCRGCHSDHTWDFTAGSKLVVEDLVSYMKDLKDYTFDHICVLGGEPLDHPKVEVIELLEALKENFPNKLLWLYTHFEFDEVAQEIKALLDYLKTGEFRLDLPEAKEQYGVFLASNNQVIHKLK